MSDQELAGLRNIVESELDAARRDLREQMRRQVYFWNGGPPPPLSRWKRTKRRASTRVRGARTAVALRVAPWLDDY